jgi:acryloyl-coenzyme A reductase
MSHMRAMVFQAFGGPETLQCVAVAMPTAGHGEVLVRVHAAGICYHDILSRSGKIPRDRPGQVMGHEVSGEIVAVGAGVAPERVGERVVLYVRLACGQCRHCLGGRHDLCRNSRVIGEHGGGGYGEYTAVPSRNAVLVPAGLDLTEAALACCPVGTSVRAALGVGGLAPGDTVLVTGAGGGLGLHQIQIAKAVGARVIAATGSPAKVAAIEEAGADEVVVAPDMRFAADVWKRTGKQGVELVLENVATGTLPESLRCCAAGATVVVLGNVGAEAVPVDPGLLIGRRIRVAGSGNATFEDLHRALHLMATGAVRPRIHAVLPFEEAPVAHALMEARGTTGRVVLSGWR